MLRLCCGSKCGHGLARRRCLAWAEPCSMEKFNSWRLAGRHLRHNMPFARDLWQLVGAKPLGLGLMSQKPRGSTKGLARRVLVLQSSEFEHLFEKGRTELAYAGSLIQDWSQYEQGMMCQEWARKVLQEQNPEATIFDPEPGTCCDGSSRGLHRADYDFILDHRRVEIKSARMVWISRHRCWMVQFRSVKFAYADRVQAAFDDLYLVIVSPKSLHLIKHDLVTGVSSDGLRTKVRGHRIIVLASRGIDCCEEASVQIVQKLCERGSCHFIAEKPFSELDCKPLVRQVSPGKAAVAGLPMSCMSCQKRGKRIEGIALAIDHGLHPHCEFRLVKGSNGNSNAPVDWVRGEDRVEVKSCALTFDRSNNLWHCTFACIKPDLFDELWLASYTSLGIYYYRSSLRNPVGFCRAGAATRIQWHHLIFYGPCNELDPLEAFKAIETKMKSKGFEPVAIVEWEKGGSLRRARSDLLAESGKKVTGLVPGPHIKYLSDLRASSTWAMKLFLCDSPVKRGLRYRMV